MVQIQTTTATEVISVEVSQKIKTEILYGQFLDIHLTAI